MRPLLVLLLLVGCSVSHSVRPLAKGTGALQVSMGGPISKDLPTPVAFVVPITTLGYAHGLTEKTSVHGAFHPAGLAAFGIFGMDLGATTLLAEGEGARPRFMLDGDLAFFTGDNTQGDPKGGSRLFPSVEVVGAWDLGNHAVYTGINQFVQPFPGFRYHVTPLVGTMLTAKRVDVQIEYKWMAPASKNALTAAEFVGPFGLGASAVQIGLGIRLGKEKT
ncbi:MAG: hypothetical protein GWP91_20365 [Rhodobacterales bacterium]|nr:hypothetical protein [Rhodobacterales bacterium]